MGYKVIWDDEAIEELRQVIRHIALYNPAAARKTGETILRKAGALAQFPEMGKRFRRLNRGGMFARFRFHLTALFIRLKMPNATCGF
jgi:plasmid stabilization system protein ParE